MEQVRAKKRFMAHGKTEAYQNEVRREWLRVLYALNKKRMGSRRAMPTDPEVWQLLQFFELRPGLHRQIGSIMALYYHPPTAHDFLPPPPKPTKSRSIHKKVFPASAVPTGPQTKRETKSMPPRRKSSKVIPLRTIQVQVRRDYLRNQLVTSRCHFFLLFVPVHQKDVRLATTYRGIVWANIYLFTRCMYSLHCMYNLH